MDNLLEYKCPCCGGAIAFDSTIQKLKCPFCDTEFEPETLKAYDDDLKKDGEDSIEWDKPGEQWYGSDDENMRMFVCNSCGGEIVADSNMAASSCPFCGNPIVVMGNVAGFLKPELIIPFKLDKNAAKAALNRHLSGKRLLPKEFKDQNHIDEIKGMYVPFWLFDADADANIRFRATRVRTWSDRSYNYTETSYYSVTREGTIGFDAVPVDGSRRIDDTLMESIEPYDLSQAVDFQTAYLAGYFADKYDVGADESVTRANDRIKRSTEGAFASTVQNYTTVTTEASTVNVANGRTRYALYPVWFLNTTYKNKRYIFAMNGQTGKFVGDLPMDKGAFWRWFALLFGIGTAAAMIISLIIHYFL